jgi:hypothetical protein
MLFCNIYIHECHSIEEVQQTFIKYNTVLISVYINVSETYPSSAHGVIPGYIDPSSAHGVIPCYIDPSSAHEVPGYFMGFVLLILVVFVLPLFVLCLVLKEYNKLLFNTTQC